MLPVFYAQAHLQASAPAQGVVMNNVLLNLYPFLLLVITFFGVKKAKKGEVAEEFLSPGQTKMLQGRTRKMQWQTKTP